MLGTLLMPGIAGAASSWWWTREAPAPPVEPTYLQPTYATYVATVPAPGTLRAAQTVDVRSDVQGTVAWVAPLGTRVTAGSLVARIDPGALERDLRDAEIALERSERALVATRSDALDAERNLSNALLEAERRLERALVARDDATARRDLNEVLAGLGSVSARDLADARAAVVSAHEDVLAAERAVAQAAADLSARRGRIERDLLDAEAAVEAAQLRVARAESALDAATLSAPIAGVISEVRVPTGGFVGSNGAVLTISDDRTLELVAQVDESEIGLIHAGQSASVTVMALGDLRISTQVGSVAPVARTNQNIPVFEVVIPIDNGDGRLRVGMTADASVVTRRVEGTVTLPAAAVTVNPRGEGMVTVRDELGETSRVQVEVVAAAGSSLVIRPELAAGMEIEIPSPVSLPTVATPTPNAAAPPAGIVPALTNPAGAPAGGSSGGGSVGRGGSAR